VRNLMRMIWEQGIVNGPLTNRGQDPCSIEFVSVSEQS
jgi:hypothetical protein